MPGWRVHRHEGYRAITVDVTAFWRPALKNCPSKHYHPGANRALPAVIFGVIGEVGEIGGQRLACPRAFERVHPKALSEKRLWQSHLDWVAAAIIESLGLTTVSTSLLLWEYNAGKRKTDPDAPFLLAASLVVVYLVSTIGLTVLIDIFPDLARYAPALFPILALVGAVNLALRSGHRRRLVGIAQERADRKAERQTNRPTAGGLTDLLASNAASTTVNPDSSLVKARQARTIIQGNRMNTLFTLYRDNPTIGVTDAARTLNMSRQTVYSYLDRLENDGRIRRNGHGVEILGGSEK